MKQFACIFILIVSFQTFAQNSLLWKVSGNGLESPSYIYGTMHIMPKKDFKINDILKEKLIESEVVTFEVNMFDMKLKEQIHLAQRMFLSNGQTLNDFIGEEQYNALKSFAKDSLGIKEKKFEKRLNRLTPFALNSVFLAEYIGKHKMFEKEFYKIAKRKKKEITELETIDFQMDLVTNIPMKTQIEYFLDVEDMYEIYQLIDIYKAQNLQGIYDLSMEDTQNDPYVAEFMTQFLTDRNENWIPKLKKQMQQNSCFIAVGAAHLPGEKGVLALLKEKGYDVNPVTCSHE